MTATRHPYIRPGFFMTYVANPIMKRLGIVPTLTVRGRRSGKLLTVPLGEPLDLDGTRYLVSGRGNTHWVRNLRAAGRGEFRFHGLTQPFRAVEIEGAERERIVAAYRARLGRSVNSYFARIPDPAEHPVFRMEPIEGATTSG
jgi:deazaflavin-dependent oxidoreductase (nitroreductase family)